MADIFVSYAREDRNKIASFVTLLEKQGWSVWWDRDISPGVSFSKAIEKELACVKCVLVFWSDSSVSSDWVHAEANSGLERGILIPVTLEDSHIPLIFRQTQTEDLSGWPNHVEDQSVSRLMSAISNLLDQPVKQLVYGRSRFSVMWKALGIGAGSIAFMFFILVLLGNLTKPSSSISGGNIVEPSASIAILPFAGMEIDIAIEVGELLSRSQTIQAILPDDLNSSAIDAGYTLQALQNGDRLIVSLFDNIKQQTRLDLELDLNNLTLDAVAHTITNRIAQEFNQPLTTTQSMVPNQTYLKYLKARSILRQPHTEKALSDAITSLTNVIKEAPRFSEAQASLCLAYLSGYRSTGETEDFEKAERHCFRASRLSSSNPLVNIALGHLYKTAGQWSEATNSYDNALETSPFLTQAISGLADVAYREGNPDAAVSLYKRAQHYEPSHWLHYNDLAALYFRSGQYKGAIEQYLLAKNLVTDKSLVLSDLGAAYFMVEDFESAIANWKASLLLKNTFTAHSNLGSAYFFQGDFDEALNSYKKAIDINSRDYRMWRNACEAAFHDKQDFQEFCNQSIELAEAQLEINPEEADILSSLAVCYSSIDSNSSVQYQIDSALRIAGNDIYVLYDVAVAYSRIGQRDVMNETIHKMIQLGYSQTLIERDANF